MISAMLWSIRSTPASWSSRTERTTAANSGHLRLGEPGGRLVHQHERRLGRERARDAEPSLVAVSERPGGRVCVRGRDRAARAARRPGARASRGPAPTPSAATSTFSRTVSERNAWLCWNVRASPARPRRWALHRVIVRPSSSTEPAVGKSKPREEVDERRLPGAVRPDQADDLVTVQLERDALERVDPLERARDGGGPERSSGPPIVLRVLLVLRPSGV